MLNIVFAEFDTRDRGFEAVGAVGRRIAHLEAVDRDGEAALHLIDGVKGQVSCRQRFPGLIDRPGDALLPTHAFVGRAVLDRGEHEKLVLRNCESMGVFCLRNIGQSSVLEIYRDRIVVFRKGRHRAEHQHHAKGKQDAQNSFFHTFFLLRDYFKFNLFFNSTLFCIRVVFHNKEFKGFLQRFYLGFHVELILKECVVYAGSDQNENQRCDFFMGNPQLRL